MRVDRRPVCFVSSNGFGHATNQGSQLPAVEGFYPHIGGIQLRKLSQAYPQFQNSVGTLPFKSGPSET